MNLSTFKIRIKNDNIKEDNVLLAIHSPLEVFYLSVKESALKEIPEDFRSDYIVTECDFFNGEHFIDSECIICTLKELFEAKDFKDFCFQIHTYTSNPEDEDFYNLYVNRTDISVIDKEVSDVEEI